MSDFENLIRSQPSMDEAGVTDMHDYLQQFVGDTIHAIYYDDERAVISIDLGTSPSGLQKGLAFALRVSGDTK